MARIRKPFAKVEPEFILGRNGDGMEFLSLRDDEQLIYIRWWAHCIELRKIFWKCSAEDLRILSQSLHTSFRKLERTFENLLSKGFATRYEGNICKLNGIADMHIGIEFSDGDRTVPDMGTSAVRSHAYGRDTRNKSIETPPPPPPVESGDASTANREEGGDGLNSFSEKSQNGPANANHDAQSHHHATSTAKSAARAVSGAQRAGHAEPSACATVAIPQEVADLAETVFSKYGSILRNCGIRYALDLALEAKAIADECGYPLADALLKFADACRYASETPEIHSPGAAARAKARNGLGAAWLGKTRRELFPAQRRKAAGRMWSGACPDCGATGVEFSESEPELKCPRPGCGKRMIIKP